MRFILFFASLACALLALGFSSATYARNDNAWGMRLTMALAAVSFVLAVPAALGRPRTPGSLTMLGVMFLVNALLIAGAVATLRH